MARRETGDPLLKQLRETAIAALEDRRGLVIYSKMEAQEMDRIARKVERDLLDKLRGTLPLASGLPEIIGVRTRLERMDEQLGELDKREDVPEVSRQLEKDDITWKTFEEVVWLLGIE
jgi:hypothetical protein